MRTINPVAMALLALFAAAPAFAQETEVFAGSICEIDTTPLNVPYTFPDGTRKVITYDTEKQCTGVASKRNIKLICIDATPGWTFGTRQAKGFECLIFPKQCGISAKPGDPNAPYATTTNSLLKVQGGVATLTCQYKP